MKQVCQLRALDYGNRGAGRLAWTILLRPSRPIENRPQAESLPYNCRRQGVRIRVSADADESVFGGGLAVKSCAIRDGFHPVTEHNAFYEQWRGLAKSVARMA